MIGSLLCVFESCEHHSIPSKRGSRRLLQRLLWIYCPGHAGVSGNEQADRLASTADITSGLQLGRAEVLRALRNFLNTDKPEHHSIDRLKERGVEKGSYTDIPPSKVDNDLCSTRQILVLFRGQPWGDC